MGQSTHALHGLRSCRSGHTEVRESLLALESWLQRRTGGASARSVGARRAAGLRSRKILEPLGLGA